MSEANCEERASGKGRPISTRRGEAAPYLPEAKSPSCNSLSFLDSMLSKKCGWVGMVDSCLPRSSGCEISIDPLHAYLRAKIGDGRHISSEARTRPLFADRATGGLRRS